MIDRTSLFVASCGSGTAFVLSHGVGSDTSVWDDMTPVLAERFRAVAWDQPGHGRSAPVGSQLYGPRLAYESLTSVIAAAASEHERVILLGHSLGGYLSARYAIEHPDRVAALVLLATGPGFRSPDAMEKWNRDVRRSAEKQGRPETLVGLHEDPYVMDHLAEITCPALVLVGSLDDAFLGATDYIERKVPGIERHTIEGADHMMPATRGAELASMVLEFLARRGIA